jgi:hypothetical protein
MDNLVQPTLDEFDQLAFKVTNQMREYTFPYIASISREAGPNVGEHLGSGLYLAIRQETYLLTNEHVAREINRNSLAHQLIDGENATRISNPIQVACEPYDLAVTLVDHGVWAHAKNRHLGLAVERLATKHDPVDMDFLFLMGYSGERSHFSPGFQTLITIGTPLLTQESKGPPEGLGEMFFALPYSPTLSKSIDPKGKGLPIPYGFSGAPVWNTNFRRCMLENRRWTPDESDITGIAFCWIGATAHLVVLRVEYVREFLLYALRNEAAYFRWVGRGRPSNDALQDWIWAEGAISLL